MRRPVISPSQYRRVTLVALWLLVFIVVTGASVRLTGSGLGCSEWPNCEPGQLTARPESSYYAWIEFVNRAITGLVSVAVAVAVLGAHFRVPRRPDLTWWSLGLVGGVIGQILLGGLVVLTDLNPVLVQGHFVVSMVLVANAVMLNDRAGRAADRGRSLVDETTRRWVRVLVGLAAVVLLTGTVVTGSGPHAGDEDAQRLSLTVHDAARWHGVAVMAFLGVVLVVMVRLRRVGVPTNVLRLAQQLLTVLVLQAGVGYTQYFTGVPALLVALHVLGASMVWVAVLRFVLSLRAPLEEVDPNGRDDAVGRPGQMTAGLS